MKITLTSAELKTFETMYNICVWGGGESVS